MPQSQFVIYHSTTRNAPAGTSLFETKPREIYRASALSAAEDSLILAFTRDCNLVRLRAETYTAFWPSPSEYVITDSSGVRYRAYISEEA